MDSLATAVEDLLREVADREVMTRFGHLSQGDVRHKARQGDLVTVADLEAEYHIRAGLLGLLPKSTVIGEEGAFKSPEILDALNGPGPVWVVDPIDGTRNFATGKPVFAVMCALIEGGETRMGWILDPVSGACAVTQKGEGVLVSGQKRIMKRPDGPEHLRGSVGENIQKRLKKWRTEGREGIPEHFVRYHCVGREYMDFVLGKLHFGLYGGKMMPWDHAAGALMVAEAGGVALTTDKRQPYSPVNHGHGERLLIAPDAATFETLCPILEND